MAATRADAAGEPAPSTQDIRLAVVLNGGVSLAVWISGVTFELHNLVQAARLGADRRRDSPYAQLLDVLDARLRIDVIAGTSAGGLNGGFLALGLVHGCELSTLRDLWADRGDLGVLLRDPLEKDAPSLLRGEYFYDELRRAYRTVATNPARGLKAPGDETVDLYLTGTLWEGRRTPFADDMGRRIVEVDYDATFHFSSDPEILGQHPDEAIRGDLRREAAVAEQLAVASRCTSSFPGAFEPYRVDVARDEPVGDRWQSSAGRTNFDTSQFVVDGGVLRNKPIRPAIDAVYRQSAEQQVRRILAYVVPDPGEEVRPEAGAAGGPAADSPPPKAADVLLGVMTRLRSTDSVAEELAEIRRRNDESKRRRRTRDRLAGTLLAAAVPPPDGNGAAADRPVDLPESAYPGYLEVRRDSAAQTIARLLLAGPEDTRWSQLEVAAVLRDVLEENQTFIPHPTLGAALEAAPEDWRWGQSTVGRLGDLVVDVLKRAVWLAPVGHPDRAVIVRTRARAHEVRLEVRSERASLDGFWRRSKSRLPPRSPAVAASPDEIEALRRMLADLVPQWDGADEPGRRTSRARLRGLALDFARCLHENAAALQAVANRPLGDPLGVDPGGDERLRLRALVDLLVATASSSEDVLARMLRLEVVHVTFAGVATQPEQEVELVQVSSIHPALLTGIQLHHFGAFYRESWRVNDWLRGRLDGCEQLVEMLLAPERLEQLRLGPQAALTALREVALGPEDGEHHPDLLAEWTRAERRIAEELAVLGTDAPLPRTFPLCAELVARRLKIGILEQELPQLIDAAGSERDPVPIGAVWADSARRTLTGPPSGPSIAELDLVLSSSRDIGEQRIAEEMRAGTDTFTRTFTHAAATLTATTTSATRLKPLATLLTAFRGYALLVWVLLTFLTTGSRTGRNVFSLTIGVGGALLALTLLVPAVPIGVTLAGLVLLLAAVSAAALRQKSLLGTSRLRTRVVGATVVVVLAAAAVVTQEVLSSDARWWEVLLSLVLRLAVVALIVGFGYFIARERRREHR